MLKETLYHKGADGIWRQAVQQFEKEDVLQEAQCNIVGGHYASDTTAWKVWNNGLWWPTTLKDVVNYCQ